MGVARVVAGVFQILADIAEVGNVVIVDLRQQPLVHQALHHVFRGEHHVEGTGVGFHGDDHFLVVGKAHVVDLDAGFLFKLRQDGFVDVILPVEYVHHFVGQGEGGQQDQGGQENTEHFFHFLSLQQSKIFSPCCPRCGG